MGKIILTDLDKCTGCKQCVLSCSFEKNQLFGLSKARNTVVWFNSAAINVPMRCQHCESPPCMNSCPMDAISRNEESNAIIIDRAKCIGCKMCIIVCPFGGIIWDAEERCMVKCDLCDGDPECVKHCLYGALMWLEEEEAAMVLKERGAEYVAQSLVKHASK